MQGEVKKCFESLVLSKLGWLLFFSKYFITQVGNITSVSSEWGLIPVHTQVACPVIVGVGGSVLGDFKAL